MSRRFWWNLFRIVFTAAVIVLVVRMIRLHDYVRLREAGVERLIDAKEIADIRAQGEKSVDVVWADGHTTRHSSASVACEEGLISLFRRVDKRLFLAMSVALLVPILLMSLRWWQLLRANGFVVPFGQAFMVTYAGTFFNNFLPGSVGGDITRAILAASGEDRKAAIVGTVLLDRVIGLAVMIVMGAVCFTPFAERFEDPRLGLLVYGLFGGMVGAYMAYFSRHMRGWFKGLLPFRETMAELDGVLRSVKEQGRVLVWTAAYSVVVQVCSILIIYGLARSMGLCDVKLWVFFVLQPIIFMVAAVPVSPGGWGVQEGAYAWLFGQFAGVDPNQAVALSLLQKLSMMLASLPGGVLFALGAARRRAAKSAQESGR